MEPSILMWNRLEPSARNENQLDNALRFEVRDALWMLARQWQFGELDGEDAGTAAFAQIRSQQTPIRLIGSDLTPLASFDYSKLPFEVPVEREIAVPNIHIRLEMGRHWMRLLKKRLPAAKAQQYITAYKKNRKFIFATPDPGDPVDRFQKAHQLSDEAQILTLDAIAGGRMLDGYTLYTELKSGKNASTFVQPDSTVDAVGAEFVQWFERTYNQTPETPNTWHPQHLEYQPQLAFQDNHSKTHLLNKEEYYGDGIGWYGFEPITKRKDGATISLPPEVTNPLSETVIPANVRFRGMPSTRLWEMEDAQVDFGSIRAASTELSKMLFAEFGLIYGNDWLVAPLRVHSGSLCRISGLIVTDIFGKQSILEEIEPDANWAFFQTQNPGNIQERWLFFANNGEYAEKSNPVEKVCFLRDEMANLVWAVEEIVPAPDGGGRNGGQLASQTAQWLRALNPPPLAADEGQPASEGWTYKAGISLPENRIPFVSVATGIAQNTFSARRNVILQRAALPRISDADGISPVRVRPRTSLLGNTGQTEDKKLLPFFIFEEEIPRSGIEVQLEWKRMRWFDGATHTWLARKKMVGKGEIDVHFKFDELKQKGM